MGSSRLGGGNSIRENWKILLSDATRMCEEMLGLGGVEILAVEKQPGKQMWVSGSSDLRVQSGVESQVFMDSNPASE